MDDQKTSPFLLEVISRLANIYQYVSDVRRRGWPYDSDQLDLGTVIARRNPKAPSGVLVLEAETL